MKAGIHPQYYQALVTCACGNTFTVGSTKQSLTVDICAKCHPFFTGEQRFVDALGRVERFQQKQKAMEGKTYVSKSKAKAQKIKELEAAEAAKPKSLKEMMDRVKTS